MNNEKMGPFIAELRKINQMTQKDLAAKLNITDKAVSKWERGLSYPDISLLSSIAAILGVTTSELLNGEKNNIDSKEVRVSIDNALQYADKAVKNKAKSIQNICAAAFSVLLLMGILVCTICDIAVFGGFTWSLFPISSIVFGWLIFFPVIKFGKRGIVSTMILFSVVIIPFLYVLDHLIKISDLILPIGIQVSIVSIIFLWVVFILFRMKKLRKRISFAISLLVAAPVCLIINIILSKLILEPIIDIWDIMTFSVLIVAATTLFVIDFVSRKRSSSL